MVTVRYFAAAAEAAGTTTEPMDAATLGELTGRMTAGRGPGFARVLARCSVLVDGVFSSDPRTPVPASATVDVLPPFAGG